jgi:NADPH2:quinone reductase
MKALRLSSTGDLACLQLLEQATPEISTGEVLVRIEAAGLNTSDVSNVLGKHPYTTLPRTPGRDFAGVVEKGPDELLGKEVWGTGKEFGFTRDGSHAQYIAAPADGVALKPNSLSFAQAAACGVPFITAFAALERSGVAPGCRILILGAGGGVGGAAVTLSRWLGAEVFAVVRQSAQAAALEASGVRTALLNPGQSIASSAKPLADNGFDVVFDTTGALLAEAVPLIAPFGRVAIIVAHGDGHVNVPVRDLYRRAGSIVGVNSLLYSASQCAGILTRLRPAFDAGQLIAPSALSESPLTRGPETYAGLNRGARGKFVFTTG